MDRGVALPDSPNAPCYLGVNSVKPRQGGRYAAKVTITSALFIIGYP